VALEEKMHFSERDQREFYDDNPDKAWYDGYSAIPYQEVIGPELYEVRRFYFQKTLKKKIKAIRKWFYKIDNPNVPYDYRRRQTPEEFAELALVILSRIDVSFRSPLPFVVGSEHISPVPWAIFGKSESLFGVNQFESLFDVYDYYKNYFRGECYAQDLHFRYIGNSSRQLGVKYNMTANLVIALALLLLTDIIINCGPDCVQLFECFTNDYREEYGSKRVLNSWQDKRKDNNKSYVKETKSSPIYQMERKSYINKTVKIIEMKTSDDLAVGERTQKTLPTFFLSTSSPNI
jgi:hypothetical protein